MTVDPYKNTIVNVSKVLDLDGRHMGQESHYKTEQGGCSGGIMKPLSGSSVFSLQFTFVGSMWEVSRHGPGSHKDMVQEF